MKILVGLSMFVKKIQFYFLFILLIGIFFISCDAQALSLSPALVKLELNPGETKIQIIKLFNETDQTISFYSSVENFTPDKKTNVPFFLGNQDPLGSARWFVISPSQVTLKSGEKQDVVVKISAPRIAEPGGHYAAIFWSNVPPQDGGLKTANRLASLFLLTIKGEIKENLEIVSFLKKTSEPLGFNLEIENKGNIHLQPAGHILVTNSKGEQVSLIPINSLKQNILPQSRRSFDFVSTENLTWGKYTAQATIYFGKDRVINSQEIIFWLWPNHLLGGVLSFLVAVLVLFVIYKLAKQKISSSSRL
ncbi:MAG: hypothetical protein NTU97_02325 [Candidatus Magasanikbacteria bacterium]|nr:hypothetical protein [Candidatus Magasanikbacteria bacterium]